MPDEAEQVRAAVVSRYGRLAEAAAAGEQVTDGAPGGSCFGAAAYGDARGLLPEAALRASLGCGNPVAVAALSPGETVLDLGSGGGIDVLLSARRVGPAGLVYGLDGAPEMISLARANAAAAGAENTAFLLGKMLGRVDAISADITDLDARIAGYAAPSPVGMCRYRSWSGWSTFHTPMWWPELSYTAAAT